MCIRDRLFTAKLLRMVFVGVLSGANEVDFKDQKVSISSLFQFVNTYKHIA